MQQISYQYRFSRHFVATGRRSGHNDRFHVCDTDVYNDCDRAEWEIKAYNKSNIIDRQLVSKKTYEWLHQNIRHVTLEETFDPDMMKSLRIDVHLRTFTTSNGTYHIRAYFDATVKFLSTDHKLLWELAQ